MNNVLSLITRIQELSNKYILNCLKENCIDELVNSHVEILRLLYEHEKLTMIEIAQKINRTKATVTVLIDKLELFGLVKREKNNKDNRKTNIVLTENGQDFKPIFEDILSGMCGKLCSNFSKSELIDLEKLLEKMLKNALD